ncbi:MAG: hypothetical protein L0Y60_10625 [Beijerinckiaceae bacterium]|nr:hypothetical protein [Beijerinckiaceae bacterium]
MPHRYQRAWRELLQRCPDGVSEWQWAQAIYDVRDLFSSTWGAKIEEMRWPDDDIFERPNGLVWFLEGDFAAFLGGMTAHTSGKRIWRRPRR